MLKALIIVISLAYCGSAFGSCTAQGCTTTVKRVYATSTAEGSVYLQPDEASLSNVNCTPAEGTFFVLKKTHPLFNEIYSMALASVMANRPVRLRIWELTPDCELAYMWVWSS